MNIKNVGIAAVAAVFAVGSTGTAALAVAGKNSPGSSSITLSGCILSSTKDISNIGFYSGGTLVTKDESVNTRSFDLTTVEGIETIDTVTVKASTTVETFPISCAPATTPDDGTGSDTPEEDTPEEEPAPGDGSTDSGSAVITLSGCILSSTKDISNIGFYSGGTLVTKDESVNTRSFDLTTVEGIETIDTVTVKASTTVETFPISCAPATTPDDGTGSEEAAAGTDGDSAMSS